MRIGNIQIIKITGKTVLLLHQCRIQTPNSESRDGGCVLCLSPPLAVGFRSSLVWNVLPMEPGFDHTLDHLGWVPANLEVDWWSWADNLKKFKNTGLAPGPARNSAMDTVLYRIYKVSPNLSVITPIVYSMAHFSKLFANIYHYASHSDSLGIINLPAKKVSLVNSFSSLISCRNPLDSCFEPRSLAGRIWYLLVKPPPLDRDRHRRLSPIW
jgi:hypothetical protein